MFVLQTFDNLIIESRPVLLSSGSQIHQQTFHGNVSRTKINVKFRYEKVTALCRTCEISLYTVSQKVSTFKLSLTLSNLNRFSKFLHCWKAYDICYKTHTTVLTSP